MSALRDRLAAEALTMLGTLDTGQRAAVFRELRRQGWDDQRADKARLWEGPADGPFVIEAYFDADAPTRMTRRHLPDALDDAGRVYQSPLCRRVTVSDGAQVHADWQRE